MRPWERISTLGAEGEVLHIPARLADRRVMRWRPASADEKVSDILEQGCEEHIVDIVEVTHLRTVTIHLPPVLRRRRFGE